MPGKNKQYNIWVIHGPNLNMLGKREPEVYGSTLLNAIDENLIATGVELGVNVEAFQSNHEGAIVDKIQAALDTCDGLIINPAAYTHTSVAIRDALQLLEVPIIEIHISNIYRREAFRHKSMISGVVTATLAGFGADGYVMALQAMVSWIKNPPKST